MQRAGCARILHCFVHGAFFKLGCALTKEPELLVGIVAAVPDPAAEKEIAAGQVVGINRGLSSEQSFYFLRQRLAYFLVGIERKHPLAGAAFDGEILLLSEAEPVLLNDLRAEPPGELDSSVG